MDVSVRVSVVRIGRSRRRAVFVDFGNVAFAVDEFGQVVRIGEKVELPRGVGGGQRSLPGAVSAAGGRDTRRQEDLAGGRTDTA
jgi:hypothetical protein